MVRDFDHGNIESLQNTSLGGILSVKFGIYVCQMTILKGVLNKISTYF
jgi:hypothetical protein